MCVCVYICVCVCVCVGAIRWGSDYINNIHAMPDSLLGICDTKSHMVPTLKRCILW